MDGMKWNDTTYDVTCGLDRYVITLSKNSITCEQLITGSDFCTRTINITDQRLIAKLLGFARSQQEQGPRVPCVRGEYHG